MKLLLVCGPWGSGTTAVAGLLARLGAVGFGPFHRTRDERTANTYELIAFKNLLHRVASEQTVSLIPGVDVKAELTRFRDQLVKDHAGSYDAETGRPIFLKHPLSALIIPEICEIFRTRLIYVIRPPRNIDATQRRRNWSGGPFGAEAAKIVYSRMFGVFIDYAFPTFLVRYPELRVWPNEHARKLADFAGLRNSADTIQHAAAFVRR